VRDRRGGRRSEEASSPWDERGGMRWAGVLSRRVRPVVSPRRPRPDGGLLFLPVASGPKRDSGGHPSGALSSAAAAFRAEDDELGGRVPGGLALSVCSHLSASSPVGLLAVRLTRR
jgi:hypothetical protein